MPTSAQTRRITETLRDMATLHPADLIKHGAHMSLELTRSTSAMKYQLVLGEGGKWSSIIVMFDPRTLEAWIAPASWPRRYKIQDIVIETLHRKTPYIGFLLSEFERQGYTLVRGSETRETLEEFRKASRKRS